MSISILLLSIVFALIEGGLAALMLAFQPVAALTANLPVWLLTGILFAMGMLLSFVVIIVVGSLQIVPRAASFVRDHFGRTLALGFLSILLVMALAMGGEALYQIRPVVQVETIASTDVCFVLDYSSSMAGNADTNMKAAFASALSNLPDGQRVCVVGYTHEADVLQPWTTLDATTRSQVIAAVQGRQPSGGTDFADALQKADEMIQQPVGEGRSCSVIMLSDGEDTIPSVFSVAPGLTANNIPVFTMYTGGYAGAVSSSLQQIADETGGEMKVSATDLTDLSTNLTEITRIAANTSEDDAFIPDTLLTARRVGREGLFDLRIMRIALLFLLGLVFKLICVICVGNNNSRFIGHFLHAFLIAALAAGWVEFGCGMGLPTALVMLVFWILMMGQIIRTN